MWWLEWCFYFSLASFRLSCCFLELIKTLWWQGGIYLHFYAMPFRASLCFPLSKHECSALSFLTATFPNPSLLQPLQSITYLITPLCGLFVVPPLLTPLHPPHIHKKKTSYLHPILFSHMPYFLLPLLWSSVIPLAPLCPICILPSSSSPICAAPHGWSPPRPHDSHSLTGAIAAA